MQVADTIRAIAQNNNLSIIIVLLIVLIGIDRYLLHRRLMKKLDHETRTSKEVNLDLSSFPTITTDLLLLGIGVTIWMGLNIGLMLVIIGVLLIIDKILRPISPSIYDKFRDLVNKNEEDR